MFWMKWFLQEVSLVQENLLCIVMVIVQLNQNASYHSQPQTKHIDVHYH